MCFIETLIRMTCDSLYRNNDWILKTNNHFIFNEPIKCVNGSFYGSSFHKRFLFYHQFKSHLYCEFNWISHFLLKTCKAGKIHGILTQTHKHSSNSNNKKIFNTTVTNIQFNINVTQQLNADRITKKQQSCYCVVISLKMYWSREWMSSMDVLQWFGMHCTSGIACVERFGVETSNAHTSVESSIDTQATEPLNAIWMKQPVSLDGIYNARNRDGMMC